MDLDALEVDLVVALGVGLGAAPGVCLAWVLSPARGALEHLK